MDNKYRHLTMIGDIIRRMSGNSFMLKGWTVTLVVGIFALANKESNRAYFLVAYIPIIMFCMLDIYYLWLERVYRQIYEIVRNKPESDIDFDMRRSTYDLECKRPCFIKCIASPSVWLFYLAVALAPIIFFFLYVKTAVPTS